MKSILLALILLSSLAILPACKKEKPNEVFPGNPNLRCLIVYKDGNILEEKYYLGTDSNTVHDVRSVTKSIMATLTGIAIDKGFIQSENQKIGEYLRPLDSNIEDAKANIKISDLLSMSSGIEGSDLTSISEYENWRQSPNQLIYTLVQPLIHQPGEVFAYNSGASHLLSVILTQATGMSTFQFAKKCLFQPLNIADHYWEQDKQGNYNGSAGIQLTPHDMLKIGQLYLNKGMHNGIRIVSEEWITKASSFKITTGNIEPFAQGYGYFWWIGSANGLDYTFANGYGGQFIVIVPSIKLIVVTTNNWSGVLGSTANNQWYSTLNMIINEILPKYT